MGQKKKKDEDSLPPIERMMQYLTTSLQENATYKANEGWMKGFMDKLPLAVASKVVELGLDNIEDVVRSTTGKVTDEKELKDAIKGLYENSKDIMKENLAVRRKAANKDDEEMLNEECPVDEKILAKEAAVHGAFQSK
uniref:Uncharacterized protein n=1 Tax=Palpitomonas bilix TaxID=652834 RepID=A0A7S3D2X6_9EUKA|mmetsp:Transcript_19820/g.50683  ORF Transcript_19820/g.50683 Transcript_19820/m.50683 type:complete len:138 (+) Transcript_19820:72-485(+)